MVYLAESAAGALLEALVHIEAAHPSDSNDAFLLAMALSGEADYLVTGHRCAGLLQQGRIGRTRIVTPAIFCADAL